MESVLEAQRSSLNRWEGMKWVALASALGNPRKSWAAIDFDSLVLGSLVLGLYEALRRRIC